MELNRIVSKKFGVLSDTCSSEVRYSVPAGLLLHILGLAVVGFVSIQSSSFSLKAKLTILQSRHLPQRATTNSSFE
jgi:hypothetical protein